MRKRALEVSGYTSRNERTEHYRTKPRRVSLAARCLSAVGVCLLLLFAGLYHQKYRASKSIGVVSKTPAIASGKIFDHTPFEKCPYVFSQESTNSTADSRPLWFPQYPDSIHDNILKSIIQHTTGHASGAKSYYAQGRDFRRCFGTNGPTVACLLVHPMVPMVPSPDDSKFSEKFSSDVVYILRNPSMSFPLHQNWKDIKYRKQQGQSPENNWRQVRDEHLSGMMEGWKAQLMTWRNLTRYHISFYLPVERLMDPNTGPDLLKRMALLFRSNGFATVSDADMACVWYQSIGKEFLGRYTMYEYDLEDYTPGYTRPQIQMLAQRLQAFINEAKDDQPLVEILQDYQTRILQTTKVDSSYDDSHHGMGNQTA
jgi:hypothetical protein